MVVFYHFEILVKICAKRPKCAFLDKNVSSGNSETVKFLQKINFSVIIFSNFDLRKWVLRHFLTIFDIILKGPLNHLPTYLLIIQVTIDIFSMPFQT